MAEHFVSTSKINLFLDMIGKDPTDNYHFLQSIFMEIPWGDDFWIENAEYDSVCFENAPEIENQNTVSKALNLFKEKFNIKDHYEIRIKKNVPMGAGVGGGSGDAGAMLKWLCSKYQIDPQNCIDIAQKIGSDVPFFLYGGTALVEGKGEKITPLQGKIADDIYIAIVYPNIHISTKEAFKKISKKIGCTDNKQKINFFVKNYSWSLDNLQKIIYNIFDAELDLISTHLKEIKSYLTYALSPSYIFMTGSGSSFVLLFNNVDDLRKAKLSLNLLKSYSTHFM